MRSSAVGYAGSGYPDIALPFLQLPLLQMRRNTHTIFSIFAFLLPMHKDQLPSADRNYQRKQRLQRKWHLRSSCVRLRGVDRCRLIPFLNNRTISRSVLIRKNLIQNGCPGPVYNWFFLFFPSGISFQAVQMSRFIFCSETAVRRQQHPGQICCRHKRKTYSTDNHSASDIIQAFYPFRPALCLALVFA